MKVFRFMSKEEFDKYKKGKVLKNNTKHKGKTNSVGFCFMNIKNHTPEEALHFLSGVVSFDICAVFEVDENLLNKSYGIYASPIKETGNFIQDLINFFEGFSDTFQTDEYCTKEYSNKDFKLVKYSENIWKQWCMKDNQTNLKWIELKEKKR